MIWLMQTALADCPTPGSAAEIKSSVLAAEQAFDAMEVASVLEHTDVQHNTRSKHAVLQVGRLRN